MPNGIFVYGTLQQGMLEQVLPQISSCIEFGEKGYVNGRIYDLADYPGACPSHSADEKVFGQLITPKAFCEAGILEILDDYEGFQALREADSLFIRRQVKVFLNNTETLNAWIYWYNKKVTEDRRIKSGIYKAGTFYNHAINQRNNTTKSFR